MRASSLLFVVLILSINGFSQVNKLYSTKSSNPQNQTINYSPDDKLLVVGSGSKVFIWYAGSDNSYAIFNTDLTEINSIVFNPSGDRLYIAGKGKTMKKENAIEVWHIDERQKVNSFAGHEKEIRTLAISATGQLLASGGLDGKVKLWDLSTGAEVNTIYGEDAVLSVEFSPDGQYLASGGSDKKVVIRKTSSFEIIHTVPHSDYVRSIKFSPDGKQMASCGNDELLYLTEVNESFETKTLSDSKGWLYNLAYSGDGQYLAVGSSKKEVTIWKVKEKVVHTKIDKAAGGTIVGLEFNAQGDQLATISNFESKVDVWNVGLFNIVPSFRLKDENDKTPPMIYVSNPPNITENSIRYSEPIIDIKGLVMDESGVNLLLVNGIKTPMRDNGNFVIKLPLSMGDNFITIEAHDVNDNIALKKFIINRRDLDGTAYNPQEAKNYLLVVGINAYDSWPKLYNAVGDANDVVNTLLTKYQFEFANTTVLTDKNATKDKIYNTLRDLIEKVTPNDNLVIYYSGHGYFDELMNEGYWVPVDANRGSQSEYLSNSSILKIITNINSQHTFLVADACFSGSLFNETNRGYAENVEKYRSRWGLVSGRLEVVSDGATGENSPFAKHFIGYLNDNDKERFSVSELVQFVKIEVAAESNQTPLGNPIKSAGDEGGEFVFYKRQ